MRKICLNRLHLDNIKAFTIVTTAPSSEAVLVESSHRDWLLQWDSPKAPDLWVTLVVQEEAFAVPPYLVP